MAKVLSEPAPPLPPVDWIRYFANRREVRSNPFYNDHHLANTAMINWMQEVYAPRAVAFCQANLDGFYGAASMNGGRSAAQAFAEKQYPGLISDVLNEVVPGTREIFCVRDPRDVLMSVSAAIKKPGVAIFGHMGDIGIDDLAHRLQADWACLVEAYARRGRDAHLVRYEDLVGWPQRTLRGALIHAGLAANEELLDACVGAGFSDSPVARGHRTVSLDQSVGRWKYELDGSTQELANDLFAEAMNAFGYEPDRPAEGGI